MNTSARTPSSLTLVARALDLFELLADGQALTPHEMAQRLGEPRTTLHRYLNLLMAEGLVQREANHRYRLGLRVLELSFALRKETDLSGVALPVMRRLANDTGETVLLVAVAAAQATCLERAEGKYGLGSSYERGQRLPFHADAAGKVLLAYHKRHLMETILGQPLSRFTDKTITDSAALRAELVTIRATGYATALGQLEQGVGSAAVPILDPYERAVAALAVTAPVLRLEQGRLAELVEQIGVAARSISEYVS